MREVVPVIRATATNLLAGVAPGLYLRLTGQTGRGDASMETAREVAEYFFESFDAYLARMGADREHAEAHVSGMTLLEYGPGDLPGVAMLFLAHGARKVYCVDRFEMVRFSEKNLQVLRCMQQMLPEPQAARFGQLLCEGPDGQVGLDAQRIPYVVRPHGFSGLEEEADLIVSRAVLEHVDDLDGTFRDMRRALKAGGMALHQVDLRSHGLHRRNPLDFLEWPQWLWSLMFSNKGVPNRWRVNRYREILAGLGVSEVSTEVTASARADDVADVRPRLAGPFRGLSDADLAVLGLWVRFRRPAPTAARA